MTATMIDINRERKLTLRQACNKVPGKSAGGGVVYHTVYAWVTKGVRGVALESAWIGGRRYTSEEALQRFTEKLSGVAGVELGNDGAAVGGGSGPPKSPRPLRSTPASETRRQLEVSRRLDEQLGITRPS